jgi:hypothetical protein
MVQHHKVLSTYPEISSITAIWHRKNIHSSGASVITNASNSNIHKIISNNGDFIFTGGVSDDNITGTGTLTYNGAESNLTNYADITQSAVNITSGTFSNHKAA